ncbi:hypothetical protein SETIT_4G163900v2 [Setaria italica]|uniref:Uncharacterized protein n=1 Tax=Setaria italica TaxID=4555 RepID=A0A368QUY7_SETIT|nr:hypothetical protein SETIT_4G163900v2 [Setaria italica]
MPHRDDCRKRYKENDWRLKHAQYLIQWENRQRCDPEDGPYWRARPNNEYIRWYCASMRTKVKPSWSNVPIEDAPSDSSNDIADVYDTVLAGGHEESAPRTRMPRRRRSRDHTDVGTANVLPMHPRRERRPRDHFSPPVQRRSRQ